MTDAGAFTMDTNAKRSIVALVGACALWIPGWISLMVGVPTTLSPLPALTVLPGFFFGSPSIAAVVPVLFFVLWNPSLFRGESKIPKRSPVLLLVSGLLSIVWFVVGWNYGVQYEGRRYVYFVCAANVAWLVLLAGAFSRYMRREPSFAANLVLHLLLFTWLAWYAFPYLGELP